MNTLTVNIYKKDSRETNPDFCFTTTFLRNYN